MSEKTAVHTPTKESYDILMKAYEKKGWKWLSGDKPTDMADRNHFGKDTAVDMHDNFGQKTIEYQKSRGYTIITVEEAIARLGRYERGQEVLVRDHIKKPRYKRVYLGNIDGASFPYIVVYEGEEKRFNNGDTFLIQAFKFIKPLEEPIKEMTIQDVETALGHKVKIVK